MSLGPSHALARQTCEGAHAFGRSLRPRCVYNLVALDIELQGQLPIFRDAGSPTDLPEDVRADHVGRAGDHLQRADCILGWALDHIAAGVFGPDGLGEPALRLVQDVPLVALHGRDLGPAFDLTWF